MSDGLLGQPVTDTRTKSNPASTTEPDAKSRATQRTRTDALGVTKFAFSVTSSSSTHDAPPMLFEHQRRYVSTASASLALSSGEVSVVAPPSTSAEPSAPPTAPCPMMKHIAPASLESFSGCAAVAMGSTRVHTPPVAVSLVAPTVQPIEASNESSKRSGDDVTLAL